MTKPKTHPGRGSLETLFVSVLLLLFGLVAFTLVSAGADSYGRILTEREKNADLRLAASYVTMRLRQFDAAGCIDIEETSSGPALLLRERQEELALVTYIYLYDGALRELFLEEGAAFDPLAGEEIVPAGGFAVSWLTAGDKSALQIAITGQDGESVSSVVSLRAAGEK